MGYVEMTMKISTFCQECDEDLEVAGTLLLPANTMTYTCTRCGYEQEQSSWIEEGSEKELFGAPTGVSVNGREIL